MSIPSTSHGPIRVLVVEDHAAVREAIRLAVGTGADIEIVGEVRTGQEAIALAAHLHPEIVVMDVHLPGLNGVQATRAIRAAHPTIGVIGLSIAEDEKQAMLDAGALAFVQKTVLLADLVLIMRACHQRLREPPTAAA